MLDRSPQVCRDRRVAGCKLDTLERRRRLPASRHAGFISEPAMSDLVFILLTVAFFGLSWAYVAACARM